MVLVGDKRVQLGRRWMRIHVIPRTSAHTPQLEDGGPDIATLKGARITFKSSVGGHVDTIADDWTAYALDEDARPWVGTTTFLTMDMPDARVVPSAKVEAQLADVASSRPWDGDEPPNVNLHGCCIVCTPG